MHYTHLFFDLDRTLWDLDKNVFETLEELRILHKLDERGIDSIDRFWNSYNTHNNALWASWEKGVITRDKIRTDRFINILQDFSIDDHSLALRIAEDFLAISPLKKHLVAGASDVLDHAVEKGKRIAIITNGFNDVQHIKIKASGLDKYFSDIITSESAGIQKPHAEIFTHALGLTKGEIGTSLMIGDSLTADIQGAINAGMDQVFYNPYGEAHDLTITHEIKDLRSLKEIF